MRHMTGMTEERDARHGDDAGFTVAEQIVVMSVLSIVLVIVFGFMINATNITTRADADVRAEQDAILALRTATEDLRSAKTVSACGGGLSYDQCVTVEISKFTTGSGPCPKRVVRFQVVGGNLTRDLTDYDADCTTVLSEGTTVLIEGVESASVFTYFAADGITPLNLALAADLAKVPTTPAIEVSLSIKYRDNVQPLNLGSVASLRNNR